MKTPQAYIKVNLTPELKELLRNTVNKLGMSYAGYVRYLIIKDQAPASDTAQFFFFESFEELYAKMRKLNLQRSLRKLKPGL